MPGIIYGECSPWPSREEMARALVDGGLTITNGAYKIRINECACFAFETYGGDISDPSIFAEADSVEESLRDATLVSQALTKAGIRHWLEVHTCSDDDDDTDELVAYLHFDWPQANQSLERTRDR